jgi:ribosomal protein S18 acetylase RimI-like enzyme
LFGVDDYAVRTLDFDDGEAVQAFCERCADYIELLTGLPPGPAEAQSLFIGLPEGKDYDDKLLMGIFDRSNHLIGVLDVIRNYPDPGVWHVGLMMLEPERRGQGLGEKLYRAFEGWAAAAGAAHIRLGVVEHNERAYRFWQRMGFETVERRPPERWGSRENVTIVMRKPILPSTTG